MRYLATRGMVGPKMIVGEIRDVLASSKKTPVASAGYKMERKGVEVVAVDRLR